LAKKKTASNLNKAPASAEESSPVPGDYPQLLAAVKKRIQTARVQAHLAANRELVQLYWDLGKLIVERQESQGWGKAVVKRLSGDLCVEFPEMNGLSLSSLWRMRSFYLAYNQEIANLAQPVRDLNITGKSSENLAKPMRDLPRDSNLPQPVGEILNRLFQK
tara:strand:+ start:4824 stop:5309 length:486 start_codon:yes stop_codon:yes gene_type:complete